MAWNLGLEPQGSTDLFDLMALNERKGKKAYLKRIMPAITDNEVEKWL